MDKKKVWVVGHRNPDTDSICAAIAYANLKNNIDAESEYVAMRAGAVSAETNFVLEYFGVEHPSLLVDVGTQLKDIKYKQIAGVNGQLSMKKAWELMKALGEETLPVVNLKNKLEGIIVTGDVAKSYMDIYDSSVLSRARTQYRNICETLQGNMVTGNEHGYFLKGKVVVGIGTPEVVKGYVDADDMVIVGDREEYQMLFIHENCSCIIVTGGVSVSENVIKAAEEKDIVVITTPYDPFTVSRLINQSIPIKYFMTKTGLITFDADDYVDDVKDSIAKISHRNFPILDENQNYLGMFSRRSLLNANKKKLILVDHNEKSQAVSNVDEADILEIIDHHRIGSLETISPVYFRNQPVGCTATIVYQMYQEQGVEITKTIAGLLCAAIVSDTLLFRSPTCTEVDKTTGTALAELAGIDINDFAQKMFEAGSDYANKTEEEILNQDFKIFHSGDTNFGVSQVSAMSKQELDKVMNRVRPTMTDILVNQKLDMMYVMLTDIMTESTFLIYAGPEADAIAANAFAMEQSEDGLLLEGVVSRKKQLIPALMNTIAERQ